MRFLGEFLFRGKRYAIYGDESYREVKSMIVNRTFDYVGTQAMTDADGDIEYANFGATFLEIREVE